MREFLGAARPQTPRCVFHIYDTGHKAPYYTISPTIFGNVTRNKQKPRIHIIEMACVAFCIYINKICVVYSPKIRLIVGIWSVADWAGRMGTTVPY